MEPALSLTLMKLSTAVAVRCASGASHVAACWPRVYGRAAALQRWHRAWRHWTDGGAGSCNTLDALSHKLCCNTKAPHPAAMSAQKAAAEPQNSFQALNLHVPEGTAEQKPHTTKPCAAGVGARCGGTSCTVLYQLVGV